MKNVPVVPILLLLLCLAGCAGQYPAPSERSPAIAGSEVYLAKVKPILDSRCVVCHSCYNSPCQLKLSSYDGLDRGGSKEKVYNAKRLWTMEPSRLFTDHQTTQEWRSHGFHSVTDPSSSGSGESIMKRMIGQKQLPGSEVCSDQSPLPCNSFKPEEDSLTCAATTSEVDSYFAKHPNRGMPYGFPPLSGEEFTTISDWLKGGARGPTQEERQKREAVAEADREDVAKWEAFFNATSDDPAMRAKYRMTARYLYEHLFLAHIIFRPENCSDVNAADCGVYEIVRSRTRSPEDIEIIAKVRPYDDPEVEQFYYRFRRIHSTIVHKTHMVFEFNEATMARFTELFHQAEWHNPHWVGFDPKRSANPFDVFSQIPARSRYQFLLDNNFFIIQSFIHGPVCKGQVALNVVQDNFWLFFLDPEYDLAVTDETFLTKNLDLVTIPTEQGSFFSLFKFGKIKKYRKLGYRYLQARQQHYTNHYSANGGKGVGPDPARAIWAGNSEKDSPVLTVFRHFNSGSVHRGLLGDLPKTMWVMDFPVMERIYYALVAGFDVYGNMGHQMSVRLYMDNLRQEAETYFLDFLPRSSRRELMQQWYGDTSLAEINYTPSELEAAMIFTLPDPKRDLVEKLIDSNHFRGGGGIVFDENYRRLGQKIPDLPTNYSPDSDADYIQGFQAVSGPGTKFFSFIRDYGANLAYVRIRLPSGKDEIVSIVVHRWHDDVLGRLDEEVKLNPDKDEADFFRGELIGSYPNYFFDVDLSELPAFLNMLFSYDGSDKVKEDLLTFGVNRANQDFWGKYDWFQQQFYRREGYRAGLLDLNRYYHQAVKTR